MRFLSNAGDKIDDHSYPATTEELIAAYGDVELDLANGTETLGDALGRLGNETFDSAEEVRLATYSAVGADAVGRKHYSDRDPTAPGEDGHDHLSF